MTLDYELSTCERPAIAQTLDRLNGRFGKEKRGLFLFTFIWGVKGVPVEWESIN